LPPPPPPVILVASFTINDALNGSWWRKYKAKRQLALYDQTTQENIRLTNQITEYITNLSSKV
jgi:hypothetical protein